MKIWFQNRRAKERKQNKKRVEEKNQIEMYNVNMQAPAMCGQHNQTPNGVMNHHSASGMESQPQQTVLPTVVSPQTSASVMQRYLQDQAMKLESDSEQLG